MKSKDLHTNIMLDLEVTSLVFNPCIIEIGAIHFDIDTGVELGQYHTPVSLTSCLAVKLVKDQDTMTWLERHIPGTLETSRESTVALPDALKQLNKFIASCVATTARRSPGPRGNSLTKIWGNGAVADNVWIRSAYEACKIAKPWNNFNDMCVRTLVKCYGEMLGRNFPNEVKFQGAKHSALDDCRHQIRYLVRARSAVMALLGDPPRASGADKPVTHPAELLRPIYNSSAAQASHGASSKQQELCTDVSPSKAPISACPPSSVAHEESNFGTSPLTTWENRSKRCPASSCSDQGPPSKRSRSELAEDFLTNADGQAVSGVPLQNSYRQQAASSSGKTSTAPSSPSPSFSDEGIRDDELLAAIFGYESESPNHKRTAPLLTPAASFSEAVGNAEETTTISGGPNVEVNSRRTTT
ncbi:hypothetical protein LZ554_008936 [Drepanopeziza brunnea f. sp. 'monogermtubi']|nr:hypothetical protein LZ554_008936 [Drepanopeziza brunnea f. sp. 'monogermtubi']